MEESRGTMENSNSSKQSFSEASRIMKIVFKKVTPFLGLFVLVVFFNIVTKGNLLCSKNISLIFNQGYALFIASVAAVFVMATGNLDFSMGAIAGFSCVCATIAAKAIAPWAAIPVAVIVGCLLGMINGFTSTVLKLPSFIACLCMMFILMAGTQSLITGSSIMMPITMHSWEMDKFKIILAILYLAGMILLFSYTKIGKQLKSIGVSGEAARQSGVNINKMQFLAYTLTGFASGIAGFFLMIRTGGAATTTGQTLTTDVIMAVVFGGMSIVGGATSKISAAIIGTLIVSVLNNGMILAGFGGTTQQLVKGLLFLAIIAISLKRDKNTIVK